jgi:hypothetical protein
VDKWGVSLIVAVVSAAGLIIAAFITASKDRRDERARILQDMEIAEKLEDGSRLKRLFEHNIDNRIVLLTLEKAMPTIRQERFLDIISLVGIVFVLNRAGPNTGHIWVAMLAYLCLILVVQISVRRWNRIKRDQLQIALDQQLKEIDEMDNRAIESQNAESGEAADDARSS